MIFLKGSKQHLQLTTFMTTRLWICGRTAISSLEFKSIRLLFSAVVLGIGNMVGSSSATADTVVDGKAIADEAQGNNWLSTGRTYSENHFSPLDKINSRNVKELGLAWYLDLPKEGPLQGMPIAVDGVLYFTGANGRVYAVDARTTKQLWEFDPDLENRLVRLNFQNGANRGVAFWKGKVFVGTVDGRLIALDAKTGRTVWSVQTYEGSPSRHRAISGAPRVFNDKVIMGNGWESVRGYVTAYDTESGKQLWRFYTVPGDPAKGFENEAMAAAAKSWSGDWWREGGGGAVWDSFTYDPEFNRVYIGTGNAWPPDAKDRGPGNGDNLFTASIVALDADTGQYLWHYQVTPRETWEYDATQQLVLAELRLRGKPRKVIMQADKNGFFYVLDRKTGTPISAEKFGKANWAERIDLKTGRPVEAPHVRDSTTPMALWPSSWGLHSWQPMAFNPGTGLVYIPTQKLGIFITPAVGLGENAQGAMIENEPDEVTGGLLAWDPVLQQKRWEVHYPDSFWNSGTLVTAGNLVFQGTALGQLIAYDATTGKRVWSFYAQLGITGAPMTYAVDGVQYVSVLVGYSGTPGTFLNVNVNHGWRFSEQPRRLLTFALGKREQLPSGKPPRFSVNALDDPALVIDAKKVTAGAKLFNDYDCVSCHGVRLENYGSFAPDLRESAVALNWEAFRAVVHDGRLSAFGMPKFEELNDEELRSLYMFIRHYAREAAHSSKLPPSK